MCLLQELMRNSSDMLYSATHNQLYFKNITILVPYSWTNLRGIHVDHLATSEVFSNAPIRVRQMNPDQGDKPYTLQRGDCTEPGEFIHLTPGFLNSMNDLNTTTKYGDPGINQIIFFDNTVYCPHYTAWLKFRLRINRF